MYSPKYLVDTNVILSRMSHGIYDELAFPVHWENFDKLVNEGTIISTIKVNEEIINLVNEQRVENEILTWVNDHPHIFKLPPDEQYSITSKKIQHKFPGWYSRNRSKADFTLVVYAKAYNLILVTQETANFSQSKDKNFNIPTVCKKLGAYCRNGLEFTSKVDPTQTPFQCINFVELVRREKLNQK